MPTLEALTTRLSDLPRGTPGDGLRALAAAGLDQLPLPGAGRTLERWRWLAAVGEHDLSLAKLYEGHTDALAILQELGAGALIRSGQLWAVWAADAPTHRVQIVLAQGAQAMQLQGVKQWCSGASEVSHALLTAWQGSEGPYLVAVDLQQDGIVIDGSRWQAIGMRASACAEVRFTLATATPIGAKGSYLARAGFWQGGAGVAACWYGGTLGIARALRRQARERPDDPLLLLTLGQVDLVLAQCAALLDAAARQLDQAPSADFQRSAMQCRAAAEQAALSVLELTGRALGAGPFCLDGAFAQRAADLSVFIRQTHGSRDLVVQGRAAWENDAWAL